jgi:hypothetical protein
MAWNPHWRGLLILGGVGLGVGLGYGALASKVSLLPRRVVPQATTSGRWVNPANPANRPNASTPDMFF